MLRYILSRIPVTIAIIIGITAVTFFLLNVVPGDPVALMMKEHINPETIARVRNEMHLDDPAIVRYGRFMWGAVQGDLGRSYKLNRPVASLIIGALPNTLKLTAAALLVAWVVGIVAGVLSAVKQYSAVDYGAMAFALLGVSVPIFWSGILLQYLFGLKLGWLPISGMKDGLRSLALPAIVLGWASAASIARLTRSSLLEVMRTDYVRTAYAKGLRDLPVIIRHALQNSLLPVVTVMAMQIAGMLSGSVITESIFGIGGIGRVSVGAIQARDMPLLQGAVIFAAVLVVLANLLADLAYAFLDPRIRYD
ncbi:MAG: glutathione transporter permease GsiC [Firmicutes bacterium]|nr:glutathione transporter permease GsiC [Bacillota bacterium]